MRKPALVIMLFLNLGVATAADTASWTKWEGTPGTPTGTFVQNNNTIEVTYTGQFFSIDNDARIFDSVPTSFTGSAVTNTPGNSGSIRMTGGDEEVNNFHFSQAVIDPLIAIWSVGRPSAPVTFNFDSPFTILSQGGGYWGGGSLTQSGNSLTGLEGNGLLQLKGTYTDISFTTPDYEYYYGITVGGLISAVPEPQTYAMFLSGLGFMCYMARRRKY
ncbi:PEP-CTERM protein-sorting domain-containing protein [Nitrosospira briensis]|uniref:PEP-CTERM protein-sorting domain-containing protein n=1 Tax=Nitrosospira briensis TaxID=35799 RepID=A0A1I5EAJ5_9PROT|nr:PEP-CTERM sorting domain-containing protein [Nitrosospira briensis]SFO08455.1 PEP-CTERM protein-sorting domain-containing protein [Nitrosospira briensis]